MDELQLLREQAGEPAPPSERARAQAQAALQRAIAHERDNHNAMPRRVRRPRLGRVPRLAAIAAAVLIALAVTAALRLGSTAGPPPATAATVLEQLARVAAKQTSEVPGPGQYLYTASRSMNESDTMGRSETICTVVFSEFRQNWVAPDGHGLFRETDGPPHYTSKRDAAKCRPLPGHGSTAGTFNTWAAPGCLSIAPIPLGKLPTNPARLRARLLTGKVEGGPPGPAEAFIQVADLLRNTDASPRLRAALYRAAIGLPGVRFLGTLTDELGRRGLALAIDSAGIRHELIFNPATSAMMAEREIVLVPPHGSHEPAGSLTTSWSAYLPHRVLDALPEPSPLPLRPACIQGGATSRNVPGAPQDTVLVGSSYLRLHPLRLRRP